MAADIELRLISRCIRERDLTPLLELGVDDSWWLGDDALELWKFAKRHYTKYGECPTAVTVREMMPGYRLLKVEDGIPFLLDTFMGLRRRAKAVEIIQDAGDLIEDGNPEGAIDILAAGISALTNEAAPSSRDRDVTVETGKAIDRYMELRDLKDHMRGLPTGFPTIDKATSGLQRQQLVTIIAPPKTGKSVLGLALARNVHRLANVNGLFVSFEMSNDEHEARYIAMVGKVSHTALTTGALSKAEEEQVRRNLKATEGKASLILSDAPSAATVSGLAAKLDKYKPQICYVDGVYLMRDEVTNEVNTPTALTNITRGLKRLAQRFDIPIVISTQVLLWKMRRGQVEADGIGYSSSFYQDSDVILGLQSVPEQEERRQLKVVASRNCPRIDVFLDWNWKTTTFEEVSFGAQDPSDVEEEDEYAL